VFYIRYSIYGLSGLASRIHSTKPCQPFKLPGLQPVVVDSDDPHLKAADVDLSPFPIAEILHMDGLMIDVCQEAARQARERG
jgi:hypothetical protein